MALPNALTRTINLELAFDRVVRGTNRDYKHYSRYLYPSYSLALPTLLGGLSEELRRGTYRPSPATLVYQPKKTGVLRPLALLTMRDQVVYQAILNRIANRVHSRQRKLALRRRFGALYAGKLSQFFFRSWKVAYGSYNRALASAFNSGKEWLAEFDLVSCYELIDHNLLRARLGGYGVDSETLDLLLRCLAEWTTNRNGSHVRHGVPQGPEASAFLAECILFSFDDLQLGHVSYLRYVDDVRLLAKDDNSLRRALIHLDLAAKEVGLVPQAQKIAIKHCKSIAEVVKTVPSSMIRPIKAAGKKQPALQRLWRRSLGREQGRLVVRDQTHFRFSLYRLNATRLVLRRIASLLTSRPDLASILAHYCSRFPQDREAADILLEALRQDPAYDYASSAYIRALDVCEPTTKTLGYRRAIRTAKGRSIEQTILVNVATTAFRARRAGVTMAMKLLRAETNPQVIGLVLSTICAEAGGDPFAASALAPLLQALVSHQDPDLARFAAALALEAAAKSGVPWKPPKGLNSSVAELLVAVGLRTRGPTRKTAVELYLERAGVFISLKWKKALGADLADLERRAVRLQHLRLLDPSAFTLLLDTFNEGLVQAFSKRHAALKAPYKAAAGKNPNPDYGNWLWNAALASTIPHCVGWFQDVHKLRLQADLAHHKHKKGPKQGKPTKPVTYQQVNRIMLHSAKSWESLVQDWLAIL